MPFGMRAGRPDDARPNAGRANAAGPNAGHPDAARPDASRPGGARPDAGRPGGAGPDAAGPNHDRPDAARPDAARPVAAGPDHARPDAARPGDARPDRSSTARAVDEGVLIALSAVRMVVKNRIIIGVLREHADYSAADYAAIAQRELERLARQSEADARRVKRAKKALVKLRLTGPSNENRRGDIKQLTLRRRVYESMARALRAVAGDDGRIADLVETARTDASDEIRNALTTKLITLATVHEEPDYLIDRYDRLGAFLSIDFAGLLNANRAKKRDA